MNENTAVSGKQITGDAINSLNIVRIPSSLTNWLSISPNGTISGTSPSVDTGTSVSSFIVNAFGYDGVRVRTGFSITVTSISGYLLTRYCSIFIHSKTAKWIYYRSSISNSNNNC